MPRALALVALLIAALVQPVTASAQVLGADLRMSSRVLPEAAAVGDDAVVNATVTNTGPEQATDVSISVTLPRELVFQSVLESPGPCATDAVILCRVGPLPPGASAQVRLVTGTIGPGRLLVTAAADARQEDPNPANDQATAEIGTTGRACDRVGSVEAESLRAPRRGGAVCGLGGDDHLLGGPRGDDLLGGSGHDSIVGESGRDRIDGGEGSDACSGEPGPGTERRCEHGVFALAGSLPLVDLGESTVGYGYHESLFGTAIALRPLAPGVVMSSRGRGTGSTTAADVVVGARARASAPVTGRVVGVKRYLLYCERPDWKVVIKPAFDPSLRVLVLHLGRPSVDAGDEVIAGLSSLGRARPNDWSDSQVNGYFPDRYPHVHVEVERNRASPTPGCSI